MPGFDGNKGKTMNFLETLRIPNHFILLHLHQSTAASSTHVEGSQRKQTSWACQGARTGFSWRTRWSMRTHQQKQPPQGAHHQARHSCHVEGSRHRQTSWACQGASTEFSWRKHRSTQPHQQKLQVPPAHHQARRSCHVEGSQRKQTSWACQGAGTGSSCSQRLCALVSRHLVLRWPRVC